MRYNLLLAGLACLLSIGLTAQQKHRCGQEQHMERMKGLQPGLLEDLERTLAPGMAEKRWSQSQRWAVNTLYIPVHIIVVHKPGEAIGQGSNLTKARIMSQLEVLNEDFSRSNADTINTPSGFATGNPSIHFCLAAIDPDGNATDGITRFATSANFDEEEFTIKAETGWPREDYLNIWIADIEDLGYAYIPSLNGLPNSTLDGVVVNTETFGGPGTGTAEPYNLGRTATHEVGHYLGLQHIWRGDGCNSDDGFSDTPLQDTENYGCPVHPSPSCNNTGDMFMNYMDYTDDACMNAFSAMQANHMRTILMGIRNSLISSGEVQCNTVPLTVTIDTLGHPACYGFATGFAAFSAAGGIGPYTYRVRTETNTTGQFNLLAAGQYIVTARDAVGDSLVLDFEITSPAAISIDSTVINHPTCSGDSALVHFYVSGGTPFNNPDYHISVNGLALYPATSVSGLIAGTYQVEVADSAGCIASDSFIVNDGVSIEMNLTTVSGIRCFGDSTGAVYIALSGGSGPIMVTANLKPVLSAVASGLKAGFYTFAAVDTLGCTTTDTLTLKQPPQLVAEASHTSLLCAGDETAQITFLASGGKPPYFYSIDGQHFTLSADFTELGAGLYPLIVLDSDQCRWHDTLEIESPPAIESMLELSYDPVLEKYTAAVHITGGRPPYAIIADSTLTVVGDSLILSDQTGNYSFTITDSLGCEVTKTILFSGTGQTEMDQFSIGPNPVKDYLVIRYNGNKIEEADLKIYDISGKLIWEENQILFSPEKNIHNIFVSNVPNSIFIFKIALKFKSTHILIFKE